MSKIKTARGTLTAKDGLLWLNGEVVDLPFADALAREHGYQYAEQLVKALGGKEVR